MPMAGLHNKLCIIFNVYTASNMVHSKMLKCSKIIYRDKLKSEISGDEHTLGNIRYCFL